MEPDAAARGLAWPSLLAFERVALQLNFGRAAADLAITPTAISKTIRQLEAQLGVRLFNRTTRSVALTEAGTQLLDGLGPALERIRQSVQQVGDTSARPRGQLRINTSYLAYSILLEPNLADFCARYPEIELDVQIESAYADIVARGADAGIRRGHALQRDMIAVPIGPPQPLAVVGSPDYLQRRGTPKQPIDLLQHECVRQHSGTRGRLLEWEFGSGTKTSVIAVHGRLTFNEMRCTLAAARQGLGLAYVLRAFAAPWLATGELVSVLDRCMPPAEGFYLYYPSRAQMPGKLRALVDYVREARRGD